VEVHTVYSTSTSEGKSPSIAILQRMYPAWVCDMLPIIMFHTYIGDVIAHTR